MFDTATYWENRYMTGGISGPGSRGAEADEKVRIVQSVIDDRGVTSMIDLGCGDGYIATQLNVPMYVGYDPSAMSLKLCKTLMPERLFIDHLPHFVEPRLDLTLSMDVIFHLIDDIDFQKHLTILLGLTKKDALIYGTNHVQRGAAHVLHREWVGTIPLGWSVEELNSSYKKAWLISWAKPSEAADVAGLIKLDTGRLLEGYASEVPEDQLIVEIGGYTGRSTCFLAQGAKNGLGAKVMSIDPHGMSGSERGRGGRFAGDIVRDTYMRNIRDLGMADRVHAVRSLSSNAPLPSRQIGLLWIDGDHALSAIRSDVRRFAPLLAPGGRLVIDDHGTCHRGVDAIVKELRQDPGYIDWQFNHAPLAQARRSV